MVVNMMVLADAGRDIFTGSPVVLAAMLENAAEVAGVEVRLGKPPGSPPVACGSNRYSLCPRIYAESMILVG